MQFTNIHHTFWSKFKFLRRIIQYFRETAFLQTLAIDPK